MQFIDWLEALSKAPGTTPPLWGDANSTYEELVKNKWIEPHANGYALTKSGLHQLRSWKKRKA